MTFGTVLSAFGILRKRLAPHVGPTVLAEVTLEPPKGTNDELSFIRLVAWGYIVLHENGKIALNFLKQLPPLDRYGQLLPHIRGLRTVMSHNLFFDKKSDLTTLRTATMWFMKTCGCGTPITPEHWEKCFTQLCIELNELLVSAISACDCLDSPEDGPRLIEELQKRMSDQWDAYLFDSYVETASIRLGFNGIDIVKFRTKHLDSWRKVVALSEPDARDRVLTLRVEADMQAVMADALPYTAQELCDGLSIADPSKLAATILLIRAYKSAAGSDLPTLLTALLEELTQGSEGEIAENTTVHQ